MTTNRKVKAQVSARQYLEDKDGPLTLGSAIRSERLSREMSLKDFSKLMGVSVPQLSDIERGRRFVSAEKAASFAKKIGDSVALFIELALQDSVQRSGLKYRVRVEAA